MRKEVYGVMPIIVSCHQPNFFPYLGVFDKIRQSHIFVVLDNYQFEKGTWGNRNRIKIAMNSQAKWLTVPIIKGQSFRPINEILVANNIDWKKRHLNILRENYKNADYFDEYFPVIKEKVYGIESEKLIDYNLATCQIFLEIFNIKVDFVLVSKLKIPSDLSATDKLIEISKAVGADIYLSGLSGKMYLDEAKFKEIELRIHDFKHPIYKQLGIGFLKNLSAIDYLFNMGNSPWWKQ